MLTRLIFADLVFAAALLAQHASATISGEVRDPTGAPFRFVKAEFALEQPPRTEFTVQADEEGRFLFTSLSHGLPAGLYTLRLSMLGFQTITIKSISLALGEHKTLPPLRMDVSRGCAGSSVDYFEFAPDPRFGNLSGHVMRDERRPIHGAAVKLLCDFDDRVCGETKTDANGEFILFNLSPRDDYTIRIYRPGFYPVDLLYQEVQAGRDSFLGTIRLEHCANANCDPRIRRKRLPVSCD